MARILLADDDKGARDLVRRALEIDGHAVVTVEDGIEALAAIGSSGPFDALVADVQMPGLDGITLVTKAIALAPRIGVVLISGYAEMLDAARGIPARSLRVVAKPFTVEAMREAIRTVLAA